MLKDLAKDFIKKLLRPVIRPFLLRIRLIIREELSAAKSEDPRRFGSAPPSGEPPRLEFAPPNALDPSLASRFDLLNIKDYLLSRCRNRKVLIYGTGLEARNLNSQLSAHNIQVDYFIDENASEKIIEGRKIRSYLDIAYETSDSFFIIVANEKENYGITRQKFIQLGLTENVEFTSYRGVPDLEVKCFYDVTLSHSRVRGELEGFEVFGDKNNHNALRIVALGGSTTESTLFYIKGWAQYLADIFSIHGISVVLYCGGVVAYTSTQEMLKLIRDVLPLKPDIVLQYSGWNDLLQNSGISCKQEKEGRPFITNFQIYYINTILAKYPKEDHTVYYGLKNNKTASELWLDNTRIMHSIANEFNMLFLSFLQPSFFFGQYDLTASQKVIISRKWGNVDWANPTVITEEWRDAIIDGYEKLKEQIKDFDYITDLTDIFAGLKDIYLDNAHVTEEGNKIIAENIYKKLSPYLDNGKTK